MQIVSEHGSEWKSECWMVYWQRCSALSRIVILKPQLQWRVGSTAGTVVGAACRPPACCNAERTAQHKAQYKIESPIVAHRTMSDSTFSLITKFKTKFANAVGESHNKRGIYSSISNCTTIGLNLPSNGTLSTFILTPNYEQVSS